MQLDGFRPSLLQTHKNQTTKPKIQTSQTHTALQVKVFLMTHSTRHIQQLVFAILPFECHCKNLCPFKLNATYIHKLTNNFEQDNADSEQLLLNHSNIPNKHNYHCGVCDLSAEKKCNRVGCRLIVDFVQVQTVCTCQSLFFILHQSNYRQLSSARLASSRLG